ncbi:MAG: hypothetical protein ACLSBB_10205 [Ruthenibacterium lactatiformans]
MAEFFNEYGALLWEGTLETLYMTLFATLFAYVLGLPMGVLLTVTKAGGWPLRRVSTRCSDGW